MLLLDGLEATPQKCAHSKKSSQMTWHALILARVNTNTHTPSFSERHASPGARLQAAK